MGTGYKGGALEYHALKDNAETLKANFKFNEKTGYFGTRGKSADTTIRNISSADPISTATKFYEKAAFGGIESPLIDKNGNRKGFRTDLKDGTVVSFREVSSSDGTPVVELKISTINNDTGQIRRQKIHFIQEEKK